MAKRQNASTVSYDYAIRWKAADGSLVVEKTPITVDTPWFAEIPERHQGLVRAGKAEASVAYVESSVDVTVNGKKVTKVAVRSYPRIVTADSKTALDLCDGRLIQTEPKKRGVMECFTY